MIAAERAAGGPVIRAAMACQAILGRDLRAVLRSRSQLYSSLLFPLMLLAILGAGVSEGLDPSSSRIRDGDYTSYLVPGLVVMAALFSSTFSSASYYHDRDSGLLRVMMASPHSPRVILLGKALAGVLIGAAQGLGLLAVAALIPGINLEWQFGAAPGFLLAAGGGLLLAVFLNGFAQLMAARIRTMQGFHLVMNLVLFPLLFFSGAFFPLDDLPLWLKVAAAVNPLSYAVDLVHIAAYTDTNGHFGLAVDLAVLGVLAPAVFLLGIGSKKGAE
ncbi:MAG: ABC transporter permease [Dehalococcoidia bacterium]|nr:ABC transporter permease [Dehalococcoidia bacterium]